MQHMDTIGDVAAAPGPLVYPSWGTIGPLAFPSPPPLLSNQRSRANIIKFYISVIYLNCIQYSLQLATLFPPPSVISFDGGAL